MDTALEDWRRFEKRWGLVDEQIAQDLIPGILQPKAWTVLKSRLIPFDRQVFLAVAVTGDSQVASLAVQVKGGVWHQTSMADLRDTFRQPAFLASLQRQGFEEPIVPAVFSMLVYSGADEPTRRAGIRPSHPHGKPVAPPLRPNRISPAEHKNQGGRRQCRGASISPS